MQTPAVGGLDSAASEYKSYELGHPLSDSASPGADTNTSSGAAARRPEPAGGATHVEIFVRVKPVPSPSQRLAWDDQEGSLSFRIPKEASAGLVNNQRENYEFRFNGIIGPQCKQDEVGCFVTLGLPAPLNTN
jgi:hypothetical protein